MGDYGFFDFGEDADDCSYPHRLVPGTWEVFEAWAIDPDAGDTIVNISAEHKAGAAGLGVALCAGKDAVASEALRSLAQGGQKGIPETGSGQSADDDEAEPFVVLLEFPASADSWKATFGRAPQLLAGRPHGRRSSPWEDREQSSFWLAAYTARDGRFQLEMGLGSHPDSRLFRAKFGSGPPPFTHVGLAGLWMPGEEGGEAAEVALREVRVQRGLSLDPAPAAGAAEGSAEEVAAAEGEPTAGEAEAAGEAEPAVEAEHAGETGEEAAGPAFDASAALAAMAGALEQERRAAEAELAAQRRAREAGGAAEEEAARAVPEEVIPSWRLPGGFEGRAGGILLEEEEREALVPSLEAVLERLKAEEEGHVSASTSSYDPRPPKEVTAAAVALVAGPDEEEGLEEGLSGPPEYAEAAPAAAIAPPPVLPAIADHPFVPVAEEDAEAQRERAEALRERARKLRADRAKRRDERIAELRAEHELSESRKVAGLPPKNLGLGRAPQGRQTQAASSQRPARGAVAPWLRDLG